MIFYTDGYINKCLKIIGIILFIPCNILCITLILAQ